MPTAAAMLVLAALSGCASSKDSWASAPGVVVVGNAQGYRALGEPERGAHDAQYVRIAGLAHRPIRVLVRDALVPAAAGDLVAAKGDPDGVLWLDRVLCKSDESYRSCAVNYRPGLFDASTGQELAPDRKPKPGGVRVDVSSYVNLSVESGHHTASELDARAGQHCDCNRALPGSAQSVVHVPQADR